MGTAVEVRRTLDLTRAPQEQWNAEMVKVVTKNVFRGKEITEPQLYYCLSVAESLGLNPMIGEIYFLPSRSKNAQGPAWTPYIGRNGLVAKATERACYFESETVHENDRFRMTRSKGEVNVTHSYGMEDRGAVIGAYAFLHDDDGRRKPAFFYAKLTEYLPTFDQDWKMDASPWGNQRSAMIEKCAMIGAGRKRLNLGNVLADGEVERVAQQNAITGPLPAVETETVAEFDWSRLAGSAETVEQLREAVAAVNELSEGEWPAAKLELVLSGMTEQELERVTADIEAQADELRARLYGGEEPVRDAEVVEEPAEPQEPAEPLPPAVELDKVAALKRRAGELEDRIGELDPAEDRGEHEALTAELGKVERELAAAEDPGQGQLL